MYVMTIFKSIKYTTFYICPEPLFICILKYTKNADVTNFPADCFNLNLFFKKSFNLPSF